MKVELTAEEVGRLLARAAVEKANAVGRPYLWSDRVKVVGLVMGVRAELVDGRRCQVELYPLEEPKVEPVPF